MTVAIREAIASDRQALIDLWVEAWAAAMPDIDFEARRPWFSTRLDELVQEGALLFVAVDNNDAPLGFISVDTHRGSVDQLAVSLRAQRGGMGARLLDEAKRRSPYELRLTVNTRNVGAIALYTREGFSVTGEGTNPLSGLPVLQMRWAPAD